MEDVKSNLVYLCACLFSVRFWVLFFFTAWMNTNIFCFRCCCGRDATRLSLENISTTNHNESLFNLSILKLERK